MYKNLLSVIVILLLVAGCTENQYGGTGLGGMGTKQTVGTVGGAVAGGLIGSQIGKGSGRYWAIGAGTLLGALVGSSIGKQLDDADYMAAHGAMSQAYNAPIGQQIVWNNPNSGNYGSYTPVREGYQTQTNAYCREFQQTVTVGGKTQKAYGTACRQPDGSWQIVD